MGTLAPEIEDEWLIWRVWQEKGVSLRELREEWSYEDLLKANAVLDMSADYDTALETLSQMEMEAEK